MKQAHIVKSFDEDLAHIESMIIEMGGLVEAQIAAATEALSRHDRELAAKVVSTDKLIDRLEAELDDAVVKVLALRHPVAEDLRSLLAAFKVSGNLERIGDYAKNIAKRTKVLVEEPPLDVSTGLVERMSKLVQTMVKDVLDAYVARDTEMALDVRMRDEEVDQMHNTLYRELLTYMMEDPRNITPCMHRLFIAKNIERMGDHVTGITEQLCYLVTGAMPDDERPKGDTTSSMAIDPKDAKRQRRP